MSEADEVARLKAELASLQQETAALKKPKKKKQKGQEEAQIRRGRPRPRSCGELEGRRPETAALTGAPPPEKKRKKDKSEENGPRRPRRPTPTPPARRAYVGGLPRRHRGAWRIILDALRRLEGRNSGFEDNPERCCGIAYVTFMEPDSLDRALTLDGESFKGDGRTMKIRRDRTGNKPRRPPPPRIAGSLTVYVGNMPWAASKEEVETMSGCRMCCIVDALPHGWRGGPVPAVRRISGRVVSIEWRLAGTR